MNNVGEFFFSSPIDPFDLSKDWGRSDDDQRHRLVINGSVRTSQQPATNQPGLEGSGAKLGAVWNDSATILGPWIGTNPNCGTTPRARLVRRGLMVRFRDGCRSSEDAAPRRRPSC
jgi:hypothetical protein